MCVSVWRKKEKEREWRADAINHAGSRDLRRGLSKRALPCKMDSVLYSGCGFSGGSRLDGVFE